MRQALSSVTSIFSGGNTPRSTPNATPRSTPPVSPRGKGEKPQRKNSKTQGDTPEAVRTEVRPSKDVAAEASPENWEVLWQDTVNVRQAADCQSNVLGSKEKGTIVRGCQQGSWVALSDEPGFMLISDSSFQLLRKQASASSDVWQVIWQDCVHVREAADCSAKSLGVRQGGCAVKGSKQGAWVALSEEPGFMLINDGTSELLRLVAPSQPERWEVAWPDGVHVRSACDRMAPSLGIRERSSIVLGRSVGEWLVLTSEPGYMLISVAESGTTLLRKAEEDPDLDAMMRAAEAKKNEVEAKASRLMKLFAGIEAAAAESDRTPPQTPPSERSCGYGDSPQERLDDIKKNVSETQDLAARAQGTAQALSQTVQALALAKTPEIKSLIVDTAKVREDGIVDNVKASPRLATMLFPPSPAQSLTFSMSVEAPCAPQVAFGSSLAARLEQLRGGAHSRTNSPTPSMDGNSFGVAVKEEVKECETPVETFARLHRRLQDIPSSSRDSPVVLSPRGAPEIRTVFAEPPRIESAAVSSTAVPANFGSTASDNIFRPLASLRSKSGPPGRSIENPIGESFRDRVQETRGRVDRTMQNISDVRSRLGAQENRLTSLTQSFGQVTQAYPRAASQPPRPEVSVLFSSMVEELQNISALANRGEQASKEVETARWHLKSLTMESATSPRPILLDKDERTLREQDLLREGSKEEDLPPLVLKIFDKFRREITEDLRSLRGDVDSFKEQLRSISDGMSKDLAIANQASGTLSPDVAILRGTLAETAAMLKSELCELAGQALQNTDRSQVNRQDLEDAMLQVKRDVADSLTATVSVLREEITTKFTDLRNRIDKTGSDAQDARRGLDALQEDVSAWVTQKELSKTTEFMSKEFRVMLDMAMQDYMSASRQELAQVTSQLRRELRPLADFGASADSAATRKELTDAMEELRQELAPKVNGKAHASEASRLAGVVGELIEDVAQLGSKLSPYREELSEAKRRVEEVCEDVGILKTQGRIRGEDARLEQEVLEQVLNGLRGEQRQALEGLRQEVSASQSLRKDLACIVEKASQSEALSLTYGASEASITRRDLDVVIDNVKQELAQALDWKQQSLQFVSRQELADLVEPMMDEVTKRLNSQKTIESPETQRLLASLAEDVVTLQRRLLSEEALQGKEAVEQKFRLLRQELDLKIEEIRAQLPRVTSPEKSQAGDLMETEKDFGNLKSDLNCLKTRQEFLRQELKCLVDTASKSR